MRIQRRACLPLALTYIGECLDFYEAPCFCKLASHARADWLAAPGKPIFIHSFIRSKSAMSRSQICTRVSSDLSAPAVFSSLSICSRHCRVCPKISLLRIGHHVDPDKAWVDLQPVLPL